MLAWFNFGLIYIAIFFFNKKQMATKALGLITSRCSKKEQELRPGSRERRKSSLQRPKKKLSNTLMKVHHFASSDRNHRNNS